MVDTACMLCFGSIVYMGSNSLDCEGLTMKIYEATEQAYKNGYEQGYKDATDNNVGDKLTPTGCEYCQEDAEGYRRMIGAFSITNPFHGKVWQIETCHCKPRQIFFCPMCGRKLAEPPKGE
jgi:hypothetical protein